MFEDLANSIGRIFTSDNFLMTLLVVPIILLAERVYFARRVSWHHYRFAFKFFIVNGTLLGILAPTISYLTATGLQSFEVGLVDLSAFGFGGIAGSLLALVIVTFVTDFFYYWFHRTLHKSRVLWQMHLLHHSDENMNVMTAQRGHIFETLISPLFITLPMTVLFQLPALEIAILSLIPQAYHFLSHANIRLNYGRFWWLIISPDYHRIHHSIEIRHRDRNFANWFPVWDILFGTALRPVEGERPETGVSNLQVKSLLDAYLLPVRGWMGMRQKNVTRPTGAAGKTDSLWLK